MFQTAGILTHVQNDIHHVFTNLTAGSLITHPRETVGSAKLTIGEKIAVCPESLTRPLVHCGFQCGNNDDYFWEGKFVFLEDGTFFIMTVSINHNHILKFLKESDRPQAKSAGSIRVSPSRVNCYGKSLSLRIGTTHDCIDEKAIARHLGIRCVETV